jgi:two-component system, OmpR family, response regulator CpxR
MDDIEVTAAAENIIENAKKPPLRTTPASRNAMADFLLDCKVYVALAEEGHDVGVESKSGDVTVTINRYVMRLESYEEELSEIVSTVPGVKSVKTKVGPHFNQPNIYPKLDLPKKILLVDDEKEFVTTLSERLQTRNLEAAIAYDGEEALSIIENDVPEVMVLDLKMPGIDGLEVLRRVKREHPETEVIILTGHGSEAEKQLAGELGAFAYLQKPVDIDVLSQTMKDAYQAIAQVKSEQKESDEE